MRMSVVGMGTVLALFSVACGGEDSRAGEAIPSDGPPLFQRLQQLDSDLTSGARGADVRALHEYLTAYGYFPNAALAEMYPAWRPLVASPPAAQDVFDGQTTIAVLELQAHMSLPQTGIVDAATRAILKRHRCGFPEGVASADASEKFAHLGSRWGQTSLLWEVIDAEGVTQQQAEDAAEAAFATWANVTSLTFTQVFSPPPPFPSNADIVVTFGPIDPNLGARTVPPNQGGDVIVNTVHSWSVATPTPPTSLDLQTILLHEFGHSLGVDHSSLPGTVMFPVTGPGIQNRSLTIDDKVAISSIYDTWRYLGQARDIAVGLQAWKIGNSPIAGGYRIEKWSSGSSTWTQESANGGAVRIAVGTNERPWVVNGGGAIFRRSTGNVSSGSWEWLPGCATDIGVGTDGVGSTPSSVWSIGCNAQAGGFNIQKWNGFGWTQVDGIATRITVDHLGRPWVVNDAGSIFRRSTSNATDPNAFWETLPGRARDIGFGGGYAWVIGWDAVPGGFSIQVWNEQPNDPNAPGRVWPCPGGVNCARWIALPGGASNIAVDGVGTPWVSNPALDSHTPWK